MAETSRLVTVREMAERTGIAPARIREWLKSMARAPVALHGAQALYLESTLVLLETCIAADPSDNLMVP